MVSISKIIGVSSAFVLCLGLSNVTGAAENQLGLSTGVEDTQSCTDKNVEREVGVMKCGEAQGFDTIKGEVLRVDGDSYLIQGFDGKEVRYNVDSGTQMRGPIGRGDTIEMKVREVNNEKRVLSLRQLEK